MQIKYIIQFFSDWHCGSGLAAGADVDLLVVKDKDHLPFVPGKTLKGLIREAVDDINQFTGNKVSQEKLNAAFGSFKDAETLNKGYLFFADATFPENEGKAMVKHGASKYMYRSIASTAIDNAKGIAYKHSLRKIEVTIPCTLQGKIIANQIDKEVEDIIKSSFNYIKRLGQNRNRGLGRCQFTFTTKEED